MGLLYKAIQYKDSSSEPQIAEEKIQMNLSDLSFKVKLKDLILEADKNVKKIEQITGFINYFINACDKHLKIKKIAGFILNPLYEKFSLWQSIGFNREQPQSAFSAQMIDNLMGLSTFLAIDDEDLMIFADQLSREELEELDNLALFPITYKSRIFGFFLLADIPGEILKDEDFQDVVQRIQNPALEKALETRLETIREIECFDFDSVENLENEFSDQLEYANSNHTIFKIMGLSLKETLNPIMNENNEIAPILFQEDFVLLMKQLFKYYGKIYNLKSGNLLLTIHKLQKFDLPVLRQHLIKTVKNHFSKILKEQPFNLNFTENPMPLNSDDIRKLISDLL